MTKGVTEHLFLLRILLACIQYLSRGEGRHYTKMVDSIDKPNLTSYFDSLRT